jgi:antitoxin (DNA-binding transcriptional repressor) of toxin-antitoxin stability system
MRKIKIRELRGSTIEDLSRSEELVGITNGGRLAAVLVPVTQGWIEHIIESNWSRVAQSIVEGQHERLGARPLVSLEAALLAASTTPHVEDEAAQDPPVRTVRVGDLSGGLLQEAGAEGQIIAVTNERVVVAFLLPVTERLVNHLVANNITRVMYNVARGERERQSGDPLTTLGEALALGPEDVKTPGEVAVQRSEKQH